MKTFDGSRILGRTVLGALLLGLGLMDLSAQPWVRVPVDTKASLRSLHFPARDTGYILGDSGVFLKTVDGGSNWTKRILPGGINVREAQFPSATVGWAIGDSNLVYRTVDGGQSWQFRAASPEDWTSHSFISADTGWALGGTSDSATLFRTLDGGLTWSPQKTVDMVFGPANVRRFVRFLDNRNGWIFGGAHVRARVPQISREVLGTTDGGVTWNPLSASVHGTPARDVHFYSQDTAWIAGGVFYVYDPQGPAYTAENQTLIGKTTDGGTTWQNQAISGVILNSVHFRGKDTGYVVGDDGVIFKTHNGGTTWRPESSSVATRLNAVRLVTRDKAFAVGDSGTLLQGDPAIPPSALTRIPAQASGQVRFNAGFVHYRLPYVSTVSLALRDARGRLVWERQVSQAPGDHSVPVSMGVLAPGSYILDFKADGIRASWRLIKTP